MKTKRLFDEDAFIKEFRAQVLSCQKQGERFAVVLDQTAFFPEGGGQGADEGTLGGTAVLDVKEQSGVIYHYVEQALSGTVEGKLDWEKRFSRMQNHSGEHLLSGILHRHTGGDNISFSLTDAQTTLAFNVPLSAELLAVVEKEANAAVFDNLCISAAYPDSTALASLDYRSKLDLTENVRIVTIEGIDRCACCAPHCARTGQIGLIKIIGAESYKGGTKLWIVCGMRALAYCTMLQEQAKDISHLLCAKTERLAAAVEALKAAKEKVEYELIARKRETIDLAVAQAQTDEKHYMAFCEFEGDDLRLFAEKLKQKTSGRIVVLEGNDTGGYRYVITSAAEDIMPLVKQANAALNGRGGGRDNMARGSFHAARAVIENFFKSHTD